MSRYVSQRVIELEDEIERLKDSEANQRADFWEDLFNKTKKQLEETLIELKKLQVKHAQDALEWGRKNEE